MCVHQINVSYRIHAKYVHSEADGRFAGNILVAVCCCLCCWPGPNNNCGIVAGLWLPQACTLRRVAPIKCLINAQRICAALMLFVPRSCVLHTKQNLFCFLLLCLMHFISRSITKRVHDIKHANIRYLYTKYSISKFISNIWNWNLTKVVKIFNLRWSEVLLSQLKNFKCYYLLLLYNIWASTLPDSS